MLYFFSVMEKEKIDGTRFDLAAGQQNKKMRIFAKSRC
jgi:hypothetical protein